MCRFVAYLGVAQAVLSDILENPDNSLIKQSRSAKDEVYHLNADGFGLAWYQPTLDRTPATFKSTLPAWNDRNLRNLIRLTQSHCFLGHVRASTVGSVSQNNCHPFTHETLSFVHNGTISNFLEIRKSLLCALDPTSFNLIQGNTDSEHFFALINSQLNLLKQTDPHERTVDLLAKAFQQSLRLVKAWQQEIAASPQVSMLNTVLTDGQSLLVSRYVSDTSTPALSLFYTQETRVADSMKLRLNPRNSHFLLIASEPLCDDLERWVEIPRNHFLKISKDLSVELQKIED